MITCKSWPLSVSPICWHQQIDGEDDTFSLANIDFSFLHEICFKIVQNRLFTKMHMFFRLPHGLHRCIQFFPNKRRPHFLVHAMIHDKTLYFIWFLQYNKYLFEILNALDRWFYNVYVFYTESLKESLKKPLLIISMSPSTCLSLSLRFLIS